MANYQDTYRRSIEQPVEFWAEAAEAIDWERRWDLVIDESRAPFYRWFSGARLNRDAERLFAALGGCLLFESAIGAIAADMPVISYGVEPVRAVERGAVAACAAIVPIIGDNLPARGFPLPHPLTGSKRCREAAAIG